ncbi:MAG: DUF6763 family protein [Porticoccaceae bacterium]|jgi:hypothetical protein|nr:hypothetical protein [Porticoccaceae bacterium]MEA3300478.1 DUF6763 family protein [Pseudomonadota bacterium]HLS98420.1 DUF6763 family protein [Porticoccaceae bacterium]
MAKQIPVINEWYQDAVEDVLFEVVAVDEAAATIEVQYEDGSVDEFDFDTWMQMVVLPAEAPEDWRLSYDEAGDDDSLDPDRQFNPELFDDPLSSIESDSLYGLEDY